MPDASKLVASACLAIFAYFLSGIVMEVYREATDSPDFVFGWFIHVNIAIAIFVGWVSMGPRAGRGVSNAVTNGVTGVFLMIAYGVFVQACNEMVRLAMKNRYDNAFEAVAAVFEIGAEYGVMMATIPVLMLCAMAAIVAGLLTEFAWRTWR